MNANAAPKAGSDGLSWSVEKLSDGHEVTLLTIPRVPPVLEILKTFRRDLRLTAITGESLTFELLGAV